MNPGISSRQTIDIQMISSFSLWGSSVTRYDGGYRDPAPTSLSKSPPVSIISVDISLPASSLFGVRMHWLTGWDYSVIVHVNSWLILIVSILRKLWTMKMSSLCIKMSDQSINMFRTEYI